MSRPLNRARQQKVPNKNIPTLCERSVRYHSVQYKIKGWPSVSTTKIVQKITMDFFRSRNEYGSGGGSEVTEAAVPSSMSVAMAMAMAKGMS